MRSAVLSRLIVDTDYQGYDPDTMGLLDDVEYDHSYEVVPDYDEDRILSDSERVRIAERKKAEGRRRHHKVRTASPAPVWVSPLYPAQYQSGTRKRRQRKFVPRPQPYQRIEGAPRTLADDMIDAGLGHLIGCRLIEIASGA